jgi:hypothetical protein
MQPATLAVALGRFGGKDSTIDPGEGGVDSDGDDDSKPQRDAHDGALRHFAACGPRRTTPLPAA